MPSRRLWRTCLALVLGVGYALGLLWIVWPLPWETVHGHRASQKEVRDFVPRLVLGSTRDTVDATFAAQRYRKLFVRQRGVDEWWFGTPSTFGASDWTISLRFDSAGLACVVVGTADDWSRAPNGAPKAPCRARR
jgi:hypothetical protein